MAGRKRKPTHLHIVQGTAKPCRLNKNEPKPPNEPPRPGIELDSRSSYWYGIAVSRLQSIGVASISDSEMVMLLAMRLAELEARDADIRRDGPVYSKIELIQVPKENGQIVTRAQKIYKANPAVAQRSEAFRHIQSLLAEFGLSPASRGKVSKRTENENPANRWESLK